MPTYRSTARPRTDPRGPLVFDTRALGHRPGSATRETRTCPLRRICRVAWPACPPGCRTGLEVRLEAVSEGVLVTATVTAPVAGECARCLEPVSDRFGSGVRSCTVYERKRPGRR